MDEAQGGGRRKLSAQELACLKLLVMGRTNKEMARDLGLSPATVASYLQSVYQKLGSQNRTHAIALAIRAGIIDPDAPAA
ncbi:hypothetical protein GCM10011390_34340 [Aureimonas endophytica]|uniref:HTH luxR-type domain-containing protein n=1 Tax=Aureimonas endophytica TaxID=2027858 RepID=A0A917E7Q4_9HYPH|nr:helix-turn-helix transcriptional regulator [Aureimonas endophytica]GGE12313.1 hypothetical protein GCM10011390_34340 [Aureimonas endophytica]